MSLAQDVRYGIRTLAKSPGFTIAAALTLALGIGANTAIFSVVNATMIRSLPYPNSSRLMSIFHAYRAHNLARVTVDPGSYVYYRDHATSFEQVAAYTAFRAPQNLTGVGDPERVKSVMATANLFAALGTQPVLGRTFTVQEDTPGAGRVALLSYALWNRRFGGDRKIVGREITLDGQNYSIVGVMPKGFQFPEDSELWVPICFTPQQIATGSEYLNVVATLRPGVGSKTAIAEMAKLTHELLVQQNDFTNPTGWSANAQPLQEASVSDVRTAVLVLLGAVMCVLLIACANVANLLLARATARQKEIAIRSALGASRWRVMRQLLTEGVLLGVAGGALGLVLAYIGLDTLLAIVPISIPAYIQIKIDGMVMLFTFALAVVTGLLFSLIPSLHVARTDINELLKEAGRSSSSLGPLSSRSLIATAQLALSMILLISAALLMKTFIRVQNSNLGFNPEHILTFRTTLPGAKYNDPAKTVAFYDQLIEKLRSAPGVTSAAITTGTPLSSDMMSTFDIEGRTFAARPHVHVASIGTDYFKTMQIPLETGRVFGSADRDGGEPVAIIDDLTARAWFQGEDPVGKKLRFRFEGTDDKPVWRTIVGVVGSVKHTNPLAVENKGEVFLPFAQRSIPSAVVAVRTSGDPLAFANTARTTVLSVDPLQPIEEVQSMDDMFHSFVAQPRFNMVLLGSFAALSLVLSVIGIYGVMAYSVTQRTHEFGIRMALGARSVDVLKFVLGQAFRLAATGLLLGVLGAIAATRTLGSLLFGVKATDPWTFAAMAVLLLIVALFASYLPARRATRVDPMVALRYE